LLVTKRLKDTRAEFGIDYIPVSSYLNAIQGADGVVPLQDIYIAAERLGRKTYIRVYDKHVLRASLERDADSRVVSTGIAAAFDS
jgi:hypothetical protein